MSEFALCLFLLAGNARAAPAAPSGSGRSVERETGLICAASAGDPAACSQAQSPERCRAYVRALPMMKAYATRDPAFPALCAAVAAKIGGGPRVTDAYASVCREWWAYRRDPRPFLKAIAGFYYLPFTDAEARQRFGEMTFDPAACARIEEAVPREMCRQMVQYRAATSARDSGHCRGAVCRMLMGGGAAACAQAEPDAKAPPGGPR